MAHTHGLTRFHGWNRPGTMQTGKAEHIRIYSAHHMESNGVIATRQELVDDGFMVDVSVAVNTIRINGVDYSVDVTYDQAYIAQTNFDNLMTRIQEVVNIVSVDIQPGRAETVTSLATEFATLFLGGTAANTFGSELLQDGGIAWQIDIVVEQKGTFRNSAQSTGFVKGATTTPATGNNGGSSSADVGAHLDGMVLYATQSDTAGGDLRIMDDADTTGAFVDGTNILTGVAGAYGGAFGDQVTVISEATATFATSQTVVIEVFASPNTQSLDLS